MAVPAVLIGAIATATGEHCVQISNTGTRTKSYCPIFLRRNLIEKHSPGSYGMAHIYITFETILSCSEPTKSP